MVRKDFHIFAPPNKRIYEKLIFMKKNISLFTILLLLGGTITSLYAQSWIGTSHLSRPILYSQPDTTLVGIGTHMPSEKLHINGGNIRITNSAIDGPRLKLGTGNNVQIGVWEGNHVLSFKANKYNFTNGNVGIGVCDPQYKLDVNGKLFLRSSYYNPNTTTYYSYLYWEAHKLELGQPQGTYRHTIVDIVPGGCSAASLYSQLSMYQAYNETEKEEKIRFATNGDSWVNNTSNLGIGTNNPLYKLDVRGTIRADEILVNNVSGADFVFYDSFQLRPLSELKKFVEEYQHLPEIPSAADMQENGVNINELQIQLLQKVEELTLYIIQQDQRLKELEELLNK